TLASSDAALRRARCRPSRGWGPAGRGALLNRSRCRPSRGWGPAGRGAPLNGSRYREHTRMRSRRRFAKRPAAGVRSGPLPLRLTRIPGAALVAGAGLFLAMTALLAGSRAPADMPSFRLRAAVPDALLFASGAAFTLAVAIVIGIALSRDRR